MNEEYPQPIVSGLILGNKRVKLINTFRGRPKGSRDIKKRRVDGYFGRHPTKKEASMEVSAVDPQTICWNGIGSGRTKYENLYSKIRAMNAGEAITVSLDASVKHFRTALQTNFRKERVNFRLKIVNLGTDYKRYAILKVSKQI